jgi:hypothetical protein
MSKSNAVAPLGIVRSAAVISLGAVALAGSIASVLVQRLMTPSTKAEPVAHQVSRLVIDEWEADLARLNLPARGELEMLNNQIAALEAQIDQLLQQKTVPPQDSD